MAELYFLGGDFLQEAQLFFLSEQYYIDFPDDKLMKNKEPVDGKLHNRPCFLAFADPGNSEIYWIIPISSQCNKFKKIAQAKTKKYGKCNTIRFGQVLERETAFLIQNMCPSTAQYLIPYLDKNKNPIRIQDNIAEDVIKNAKEVLALERQGIRLIFPDVLAIYRKLDMHTKQ